MARWKRRTVIGIAVGVIVLAAAPVVASYVLTDVPAIRKKAKLVQTEDSLHSLTQMFLAAERDLPRATGKRFVLTLARKVFDLRDPRNLGILFSAGDPTRSLAKAGGVDAYAALTPERIADPAFDPDRFTSYAGPAGPAGAVGAALLADLSFGDVAVVAFNSGTVKRMTRAELGLGPDDPLVAGPTSKSPLLRSLSDR